MTVATALAVSWKPFTNSKPSAISSAMPSSVKTPRWITSPTPAMSLLRP
jgi:hypothetical protein